MLQPRHHVLLGGFISYMFDALEIVILTISLPSIMSSSGISRIDAGLLVTATLLGIGVSSITVGWLSDRYGRRKALMGSLLSFGGCTCLMSGVETWDSMMLLRFAAGLGLGGVWGIVSAYIAETWPQKSQARATSLVLSSFPLGAGFAAVFAALVLPEYGWRTLFLACGIGTFLPIIYIYYFVPESAQWLSSRKNRPILKKCQGPTEIFQGQLLRPTILATSAASLSLIAYWGVTSWLPTYLITDRGFDLRLMTTYLAVLNAITFVGYLVFGVLADRFGKQRMVIFSLIALAGVLPFFAYAQDRTLLMALGIAYSFFLVFPGLYGSYFASLYPTRIRTTGAGFCFNIGRGVSSGAPFVLGSLSPLIGFSMALCLCAVFYGFAALFTSILPRTGSAAETSQATQQARPAGASKNDASHSRSALP